MTKYKTSYLTAALVFSGVLLSGPASAGTAYATAHLNLRTGPGFQYPVIGVMEYNTRAQVFGCLANFTWCNVSVAGIGGWASGEYLVENMAGQIKTIGIYGSELGIPVVTAVGVEVVAPAPVVGAVVALAPDGSLIEAVAPPAEVVSFVLQQQVAPVFVNGEVVVGVTLPTEVQLYEIPQSPYLFTVVNGQHLVIEGATRKVVYIHR